MHLQTQLIHAGEEDKVGGAVVTPIFQSATFASHGGEQRYEEVRYIRLNNTQNHRLLHARLAAICGGEAALVAASGMAAISAALLSVLKSGDHLLAQRCLYGGTHGLLAQELPAMGVAVDFVDGDAPDEWAQKQRPETRAIYVETMTNPLLEIADLEAVVDFARARQLVSIIDNTFAPPANFRPLALGFDLELHSATKYLNGHSDIVAGAAIGRTDLIEAMNRKLGHLGGSLDPHACFLLERGLKTLALRLRQHDENGLRLARFLAAHEKVARVYYPGLPTHPQHGRARRLFGGYGGVLSFALRGGAAAAERLVERLRLPVFAPSLGGVETLITRPALTSHAGLSAAERAAIGIGDDLLRVALGIEDGGDLCADFAQALAGV